MISAEEFLSQHPAIEPACAQNAPAGSLYGSDAGRVIIEAEQETYPSSVRARRTKARARHGNSLKNERSYSGSNRVNARRTTQSWSSSTGTTVDNPNDIDACREAALRLLDAAPRPSGALRERLLGKGYDETTVDAVVERLQCVNLIDDESYAQSAVRYCCGRLLGARGTLMDLIRRGVDRETAERAVHQADEQGAFEDAAWELGRQYARKTAGMDPVKRRQRFWSAGGRKGHNPETLRRVAAELL